MGILDWFLNRPAQFDPDRVKDETVRRSTEKAIALTNPRLQVLPSSHSRLAPAVETTIDFLRRLIDDLPGVRRLSTGDWATDPAWRAFFAAPADIPAMLGRADNLRTLFEKYPALDEAYLLLGMAFSEQRVLGVALQGGIMQRDVVQTSVSFSDHRMPVCGRNETRLRRLIGVEAFEYLLSVALNEIGRDRAERQELEANRALIRARLRLFQQQGPGLGSLFGDVPAAKSEQERLEAELLENERQLQMLGGNESVLEMELDCLKEVLDNPHRYLNVEQVSLRLNAMNVVLDEASPEHAADVGFSLVELSGSPPVRRAFVLARVARGEFPSSPAINFADAARYL